MEAHSISKFNRISVRKLCRVTKLVSKMTYSKAVFTLSGLPNKGAAIVLGSLKNAKENLRAKVGDRFSESICTVKEIIVNRGPYIKRLRYRAKGRADRLYCPSTHLTIKIFEKRKGEHGTKS